MRTMKALALLTVLVTVAATSMIAAQEERGRQTRSSYLVQVVLLLGLKDGASSDTSNIPQNTVQTLKDVETFLPYKSYHLLDTSLIRSDGHARTVMHGPSGREFHLSWSFRTEKGKESAKERLSFQHFGLEAPPQPPGHGGGEPGVAPPAPGPVLATSFAVDVGETIVVGTSKLNGGEQALLVLLTVIE